MSKIGSFGAFSFYSDESEVVTCYDIAFSHTSSAVITKTLAGLPKSSPGVLSSSLSFAGVLVYAVGGEDVGEKCRLLEKMAASGAPQAFTIGAVDFGSYVIKSLSITIKNISSAGFILNAMWSINADRVEPAPSTDAPRGVEKAPGEKLDALTGKIKKSAVEV